MIGVYEKMEKQLLRVIPTTSDIILEVFIFVVFAFATALPSLVIMSMRLLNYNDQIERKSNTPVYIIAGGVCFLVLSSLVFVASGFIGGWIIPATAAFTVSLIVVIFLYEQEKAEAVESVAKNTNILGLCFRDFFSWMFLPKLERKCGMLKTVAIYLFIHVMFGFAIISLSLLMFCLSQFGNNVISFAMLWSDMSRLWRLFIAPCFVVYVVSSIGAYLIERKTFKNACY